MSVKAQTITIKPAQNVVYQLHSGTASSERERQRERERMETDEEIYLTSEVRWT